MHDFRYNRKYRGSVQAVIFDWAGTTLDYGSRAPVLAVLQAFRQCDVPVTMEQARQPMGKAKREHLASMLAMPEIAQKWLETYGQSPDETAIDRVFEQFLPLQEKILPECAALIPGCLETMQNLRLNGIKIGASTGYTRPLMDILEPLARAQGYQPDVSVCASDVSPGRPAPWMCLENARRLGVYPLESLVKVDDTVVGIEAGLNAGMWTVGVSESGNLVGLSREELARLDPVVRGQIVGQATDELYRCGAHFVVNSIADLPPVIEQINDWLRNR